MTVHPDVALFDEIHVGNIRCVVSRVRPPGDVFGDLEVVFNPDKPTVHDVDWTSEGWAFSKRGDFGGYAFRIERLAPFIAQLRHARRHS